MPRRRHPRASSGSGATAPVGTFPFPFRAADRETKE